jgi:hypothetical protein
VLTSSVSSNTFGSSVTASSYTFSNTSSSGDREIAIVDGVTKAKHSGVNQTHVFTITIADTVTVDLTGLSFDFGVNYEPGSWTLGLSQGSANKMSESYAGSLNSEVFVDVSESLSLSGLTGLTDTSVTFTITDTTPGNNNQETLYSYFDNVTVTGTVIPEPSSFALLGLGLGSLVMRRRR